MKLSQIEKQNLVDDMLDFLFKELELDLNKTKTDRQTLNALMLLNTNFPLGEYFYSLQDKLLSGEAKQNLVDTKFDGGVKNLNFPYIKADMLVFFGTQLIRGDTDDCLENKMVLSAGVQLNEFYYSALKQDGFNLNFTAPYLSPGYNLNCEYLAKILLSGSSEDFHLAIKNLINFAKTEKLKHLAIYLIDDSIKDAVEKEIALQKAKIKVVFIKN